MGILRQLKKNYLCHSCAPSVQDLCPVGGRQGPPIRILYDFLGHYMDIYKDLRIRILLGCGILHAMRRHKAWRGGSNAQQSSVAILAQAILVRALLQRWQITKCSYKPSEGG